MTTLSDPITLQQAAEYLRKSRSGAYAYVVRHNLKRSPGRRFHLERTEVLEHAARVLAGERVPYHRAGQPDDEWVSGAEAAGLLGVTSNNFTRLAAQHEIGRKSGLATTGRVCSLYRRADVLDLRQRRASGEVRSNPRNRPSEARKAATRLSWEARTITVVSFSIEKDDDGNVTTLLRLAGDHSKRLAGSTRITIGT